MAVNIAEIGTVYDALETKITGTLVGEFDSGRLKGSDYAAVLTQSMTALIQASVMSVQEQPVKDAQILASKVQGFVALANSQKDVELKDAQIVAQTAETAIREASSTADLALKASQKIMVDKQAAHEDIKKGLTTRQTSYYDDQLKAKEAEILGSTMGMYAAGGTEVPSDLHSTFFSAVNAIS